MASDTMILFTLAEILGTVKLILGKITTDMRHKIPISIQVLAWIVAVIKTLTALVLRFNLSGILSSFKENVELNYALQSFADRVSARDLAFSIILMVAVFRKQPIAVAYLFLMLALVEIQDVVTLTIDLMRNQIDSQMAVQGVIVLVFIVLYVLAALKLLRQASQSPHE